MGYKGKRYLRKVESGVFIILLLGFLGRAMVLCAAVPEKTGKKNPHKNPHTDPIQSFQKSCLVCHSCDPLKQNQGPDTIDGEKCKARCSSCHAVPQSCTLISTEKATEILKSQLQYLGLPLLSSGFIGCGSCHIFHDKASKVTENHKLNSFYPSFWYRARQVSPHRANVFCQLCHNGEPKTSQAKDQAKDVKVTLKADRVAVCIQCHDGKKARADNHPVRVVPSKEKGVNIPENFPLSDGKVSCLTCHMMPCQGGVIEKKFLRGGPYEKRVDVCLTCHMKERYQAVNPHIQVDEEGHIMKNKCLYCHII